MWSIAEFGYVVCYAMPRSCTKNCTKLWCTSFYMNSFLFMQNLSKRFL
jgi:hypothetical protein